MAVHTASDQHQVLDPASVQPQQNLCVGNILDPTYFTHSPRDTVDPENRSIGPKRFEKIGKLARSVGKLLGGNWVRAGNRLHVAPLLTKPLFKGSSFDGCCHQMKVDLEDTAVGIEFAMKERDQRSRYSGDPSAAKVVPELAANLVCRDLVQPILVVSPVPVLSP
jgi:hypothetical protein